MSAGAHPRLRDLLNGYQATEVLHAAAVLRLPDLVARGIDRLEALARETGTCTASLERLLRTLVCLEVIRQDGDGRYRLGELGQPLRSDVAGSWHAWALLVGSPAIRAAWAHAVAGLRAGRTGFECAHGMDIWTHRSLHPQDGAVFDRAMQAGTQRLAASIARCLDGMGWQRAVDVGGGDGTLLAHLLQRRPAATGILLERGAPAARARRLLADERVLDRAEVVDGDFFRDVPCGADVYLLKFILHDWGDDDAVALLRRCAAAAASGSRARIVVVERALDPECGHPDGALSDFNMLVNTGGRERSLAEFRALFLRAGLRLESVDPLAGNVSLMKAVPAPC